MHLEAHAAAAVRQAIQGHPGVYFLYLLALKEKKKGMGMQWGLFTAGLWRRAGNPYMTMCDQPAGVFPVLNPEMSSYARDALAAGTSRVCAMDGNGVK